MKVLVVLLSLLLTFGCSQKTTKTLTHEPINTLRMSFSGKAEFNPYFQDSPGSKIPLSFIYEPLYRITQEGTTAMLAKNLKAENNRLSVKLREDVLFHDGSPFLAKDAAYSANLAAWTKIAPSIISAEAIGQHELIIYLKSSAKNPEKLLTFPIVKENSSLGTGPYCFFEKSAFDTYKFKRFSSYYAQMPDFDEIQIIITKEKANELTLYKSGETDILYLTNEDKGRHNPRENHEALDLPTNHMLLIGFNCISLPPCVRRSIYLMYDRQNSIENSFGDSAHITPVYEQPDTFSALEELRCGGFENFCSIGVVAQNEERFIKLGEDFKRQLDEFGFTCNVTYSNDAVGDFKKGLFDMIICPYNENPSHLLWYEKNLVITDKNKLETNNILRRDMPFIFAAYLPDTVYGAPNILRRIL